MDQYIRMGAKRKALCSEANGPLLFLLRPARARYLGEGEGREVGRMEGEVGGGRQMRGRRKAAGM